MWQLLCCRGRWYAALLALADGSVVWLLRGRGPVLAFFLSRLCGALRARCTVGRGDGGRAGLLFAWGSSPDALVCLVMVGVVLPPLRRESNLALHW